MKDETITRMSLEEAIRRKGEGQTDWERLRREQEAGLEPEADPDEGEFDWSQARVVIVPECCASNSLIFWTYREIRCVATGNVRDARRVT